MHYFLKILFWNEILNVSDRSSVHHHKFSTVHTVMVYVIQVFWQLARRIRMELSSILILYYTLLHIIWFGFISWLHVWTADSC